MMLWPALFEMTAGILSPEGDIRGALERYQPGMAQQCGELCPARASSRGVMSMMAAAAFPYGWQGGKIFAGED